MDWALRLVVTARFPLTVRVPANDWVASSDVMKSGMTQNFFMIGLSVMDAFCINSPIRIVAKIQNCLRGVCRAESIFRVGKSLHHLGRPNIWESPEGLKARGIGGCTISTHDHHGSWGLGTFTGS